MIDKYTNFFWYFSEFFSELITTLCKMLFKNSRMEFSFIRREKTPDTVFEMRNAFLEFENSYSERKMVIISNEIRLIVGYIVSTKHSIYTGNHISFMWLSFPTLLKYSRASCIFPCVRRATPKSSIISISSGAIVRALSRRITHFFTSPVMVYAHPRFLRTSGLFGLLLFDSSRLSIAF